MRKFWLALLIVLLPLRGWMGDAMALEPVHQAAMQQAAAQEPCPGHEHPHDHPMAMDSDIADFSDAAFMNHGSDDTLTHTLGCDDCKVCQLCHGTALSLLPASLYLPHLPRSAPQSQPVRLSSVAIAPTHKPPIL
jgi:hypothetical protein